MTTQKNLPAPIAFDLGTDREMVYEPIKVGRPAMMPELGIFVTAIERSARKGERRVRFTERQWARLAADAAEYAR